MSSAMATQHLQPQRQRFAWTVPVVLLAGLAVALLRGWPIYTGLAIGFVWAALYAIRRYSFLQIGRAALSGMFNLWRVCLMLVMVGLVVALWMRIGSIPYLMQLATTVVHSCNVMWVSFLAASALSMIVGSSIATWSVVGPPLISIVPPHMAPFVAGALVSGAMVGDRTSPMSASVVILSSTSGVPYAETLRRLLHSSVIPFAITLALYFIANHLAFGIVPFDTSSVSSASASHWWLVIPPLLVLLLALLRVPLLYNLSSAVVVGVGCALNWTATRAGDLMQTGWQGYALHLHGRVSHVGGIAPMVTAVLLIAVAGAFQGVSSLGGAVDFLANRLFDQANNWRGFWAAAYGLCIAFALVMGSQMLAVIMSGNTLRAHFSRRNLPDPVLLRIVSDAAELTPAIVPWNLLGLQAAVILGVPTLHLFAFAWYIFASIAISAVQTGFALRRGFRNDKAHYA